uniref:Uncharacterized protein n=1 Tax=Anguilla anguilla TaxID=7936 RepID=A0A0E9UXY8_ANGAN
MAGRQLQQNTSDMTRRITDLPRVSRTG